MSGILGVGEVSTEEAVKKMKETLEIVKAINLQFKNPVFLSFIFYYYYYNTLFIIIIYKNYFFAKCCS